MNSPAKDTRVQILCGSFNNDIEITHSAKTVLELVNSGGDEYGKTRLCRPKPVIVADTDAVRIFEEFLGLLLNKVIQTLRTILLHALKAHEKVHGQINLCFLMCLNDIQPSKDRAFVICRSTAIQPISFRIMSKHEGFRRPPVLLQSRLTESAQLYRGDLHIIMSVDQNRFLLGISTISAQDNGRKFQFNALHFVFSQLSLLYSVRISQGSML